MVITILIHDRFVVWCSKSAVQLIKIYSPNHTLWYNKINSISVSSVVSLTNLWYYQNSNHIFLNHILCEALARNGCNTSSTYCVKTLWDRLHICNSKWLVLKIFWKAIIFSLLIIFQNLADLLGLEGWITWETKLRESSATSRKSNLEVFDFSCSTV